MPGLADAVTPRPACPRLPDSTVFVTFEGIDGSGKTTQVRLLAERLEAGGARPLVVREPGGTPLSERVRTLLLDEDLDVAPMAELLLFSAARAQLVEEKIRPVLTEGRPVLCDRFYDSTTAYQGAGRALAENEEERGNAASVEASAGEAFAVEASTGKTWLERFHRRVTGGLSPDRTFLLRLAPETALRRREATHQQSDTGPDRMETGSPLFYRRVAAAYDALAERHPRRFRTLDATKPPDVLHEVIWNEVTALKSTGS